MLRWQMDELAVLLHGRLTTEEDSSASASIAGILAQGIRAATVDGVARASEGGLVDCYLTGVTASGAPARLEALAAPATNRPREFLPGMFAPGRDAFYQFWRTRDALAFPVLSFGPQPNLAIFNGDLLYAASVDAAIACLVPEKVAISDRTLEIRFEILECQPLDAYLANEERDVAQLGSLLFVAAGPQGLALLDASNPAELKSVIPGDLFFPFPFNERSSIRGVAVDRHGRVLVTGGGDSTFGLLRIFDPLMVDPEGIASDPDRRLEPFRGSTIVSNFPGGDLLLPTGTPRRLAILGNDEVTTWRVGEEPPAGINVSPAMPPEGVSQFRLTVTGNDGTEHQPVTLRDKTLGRFHRVDANPSGFFSVSLDVGVGSEVELVKSRDSIAYVAVTGAGVAAVDVNAVYQEGEAGPNQEQSDVRSFFVGGASGGGVDMAPIFNLGILTDPQNPFPLTIPTVLFHHGVAQLQAPLSQPVNLQLLNTDPILFDGSSAVVGLEVLPQFVFDRGTRATATPRDFLVLSHAEAGILLYDVTDRTRLDLVARIRMPGPISQVGVDRENRRLYAAAYGEGLYVVDLGHTPVAELVDTNGDGVDDRILETVPLEGNTRSPFQIVPDLGLVFVGGGGPGLHAVATGGPRIRVLAKNEDGGSREITRLAPLGVPTTLSDPEDPESPELPGAFRVVARLPGFLGPEIRLDVVSLGPSGEPIFGAGDPDKIPNLPPATLEGPDGLVLTRQSDDSKDPGFGSYLSEEVVMLADLRASRHFEMTPDEEDACQRCDPEDENIDPEAQELLSGFQVAVRIGSELRDKLEPLYSAERLEAAEVRVDSVPWEMSPAVRQEPTLNPSYGTGDVAPGTLLHSGEMSMSATDLAIQGRGFDFAFVRTSRTQTLGNGPLGPGSDHNYRQRLRELPNGDVEYYDGRGRRETFKKEDGELKAPEGRFWELERRAAGFLLVDAGHNLVRFDRFGRLVSIADATQESPDTGNEMGFVYDLRSHLVPTPWIGTLTSNTTRKAA